MRHPFMCPIDCHTSLVAGAQIYLNFISLMRTNLKANDEDQKREWDTDFLEVSAARYIAFRELQEKTGKRLVPTRDISLMWAADMLRPQSYDTRVERERARQRVTVVNPKTIIKQDEMDECSVDSWYVHQQHRLLQSGMRFETAFEKASIKTLKYICMCVFSDVSHL